MACKFVCIVHVALATAVGHQVKKGGGAQVMVVSGISSPAEMCLVANGATASLESCSDAVRAGDGREIFSYDNGELAHAGNKILAGQKLELAGNSQMQAGNGSCISLKGPAAGTVDLGLHAAAAATSTASSSHTPAMAVDGRATYWASKLDPALPVEFSVELGQSATLGTASIQWEYPAKSFSLLLSADGTHWEEVASTTDNNVALTQVALGGKSANQAKVVLREAHPVHGNIRGHSIFGIRSLSFISNQMEIVTEDCSHAEQSTDARDKWFIVAAAAQDDAPLNRLRAALPALDVAEASLATTMSALFEAMPLVSSCAGANEGLLVGVEPEPAQASHRLVAAGRKDRATHGRDGATGEDLESAELLFKAAREAILHVRAAIR